MVIDAPRRSTRAHSRRPPAAALGLLVATSVGGALAVGLAMRALALVDGSSHRTVDALVETAVCSVGALVAGWLAVSALVALGCLAVRLVGSSWRFGERLVHRWAPTAVRRSLVLVVAASVGIGAATGASAAGSPGPTATPSAAPVTVAVDDLGWAVTTPVPSPTAAPTAGPSAAAKTPGVPSPPPAVTPVGGPTHVPVAIPPAAATSTTPSTSTTGGVVVVARGDSLWAIAARHLSPDATDAEIAASWPAWYRANAAVIGSDPGLIVPGQELANPTAQDGATS